MKLEEIGFYTLSDSRAKLSSEKSPLWRCELILTDKCNFRCSYCRGIRSDCSGEMPYDKASEVIDLWVAEGLKNIRFSGGEPTLYKGLSKLVSKCKNSNVERIAISTNGSTPLDKYYELIESGVNDFSISLDACCSSFADKMAGRLGVFGNIVNSISQISKKAYVTVGVVVTQDNYSELTKIIEFADSLGVSDIRIISAAQFNLLLEEAIKIKDSILEKYPILKYRIQNIKNSYNVRGMQENDCKNCYLALDDMAVAGNYHFPCIIYLREGGSPIGKINKNMRKERLEWSKQNRYNDPICRKNCLDVCVKYNNTAEKLRNNA